MRTLIPVAVTAAVLALPALAQQSGKPFEFTVEKEGTVEEFYRERDGRKELWLRRRFKVRQGDQLVRDAGKGDTEIVVKEKGKRVLNLDVTYPKSQQLTTVLAIDVSGSMASNDKIAQARKAATVFLDRLDARADTGLILFDDEVPRFDDPARDRSRVLTPARDAARVTANREEVRRLVAKAEPRGGTAYLDATAEAVRMLKDTEGLRAVLLMTDGVDLNSKLSINEVIKSARVAGVPVYTVGVGEPGSNEPVTSVLVLDQSGSMADPANDTDKLSKMQALHRAAAGFVDIMRPGSQALLLPFSDTVSRARAYPDKKSLKRAIAGLTPQKGTLLYDATYEGIETLAALRPRGKKAVVVLTDGVDEDPGSRRSAQVVIDRARETKVPLHMLGFGRKHEINETVMKAMAQQTGGSYHHAEDQKALIRIFEKLSIDLHDDGIDEASLKRLARETGGKYYLAKDVSKLELIYQELATELQSTYTVEFKSLFPDHDGTARDVAVSIWRAGRAVSEEASDDYVVPGVVVPDMNYRVYLVLLGVLALLAWVPTALRGLSRLSAGR
jgi:VWFA-related protein